MPAGLKLIALIFLPVVILYTLLIYLRNKFYDWSLLKSCVVDKPVISVGNIQIGGTGKTPLVEYLAKACMDSGKNPAILTRGYRRKKKTAMIINDSNRDTIHVYQVGDEPFQLIQNLPGIVMGVDADRCRAANEVLKRHSPDLFILDDGFQHRRISRRLDIVTLDVSRWSRWPLLFPATPFRDVKSSLKRADIIIIFQNDRQNPDLDSLRERFDLPSEIPCFTAKQVPEAVVSLDDKSPIPTGSLTGKRVAVFCGIANPSRFYSLVEQQGARICFQKSFPDHHAYRIPEVMDVLGKAGKNMAEMILTTQKDAVKLAAMDEQIVGAIHYLKIQISIAGQRELFKLLQEKLGIKIETH